MLGLSAILDKAEPGQRIMMTSFGSGAGSDSFAIEVSEQIDEKRERSTQIRETLSRDKQYIDYAVYLKNRSSIVPNSCICLFAIKAYNPGKVIPWPSSHS